MNDAPEKHPAPEKSLLVIGGPRSQTTPERPGLVIDRIGCDVAGILGHPQDKRFYSYDAVVFWPDLAYLSLPPTYEEWSVKAQTARLPHVSERYWDILADAGARPRQPNWANADAVGAVAVSGLSHDFEPHDVSDCEDLLRSLRYRCVDRLRDIVRGSAHGLLAFAIVPQGVVNPGRFFGWLSRHFMARRGADSKVSIDTVAAQDAHLVRRMQQVSTAIVTPWPWIFNLRSDEPGNRYPCVGRMRWEDHWYDTGDREWTDDTTREDFDAREVHACFPHVNGRGEGKSLLMRTIIDARGEDAAGEAHARKSSGFVIVTPEPRRLDLLLTCLNNMLIEPDGPRSIGGGADGHVAGGGAESIYERAKRLEKKVDGLVTGVGGLRESVDRLANIPAVLESKEQTISAQNKKLAFLTQAIESSVRTALEAAEQAISGAESQPVLAKLSREDLLLFLFLTGFRWTKDKKKPFSKRDICEALGLGRKPHPQTVQRKQEELESKYPAIRRLISAFRARNQKGEKRNKRMEISHDAMDDAERRRRGLDDQNVDDFRPHDS